MKRRLAVIISLVILSVIFCIHLPVVQAESDPASGSPDHAGNEEVSQGDPSASPDLWRDVYREFVLGKQYLAEHDPSDLITTIYYDAFGNCFDINEYQPVSCGLYDWDQDGTPELFMNNGSPDTGWSAVNIYTCSFDGKIEPVGMLGNRAGGPWLLVDDRYPGVLTSSGNMGIFTTDYSMLSETGAILDDSVFYEDYHGDDGITILETPVITVYNQELYDAMMNKGVIPLTPYAVTDLSESNWSEFAASVIADRSGNDPLITEKDEEETNDMEPQDNPPDAGAPEALYTNWKTAYRQFITSDAFVPYIHCSMPEFEEAFNDRPNSRSELFALHDMDLDGIPELIVESVYGIEQCDVFTFEANAIQWLGTMGGDNFINDVFFFNDLSYRALFTSEGGPGPVVDMYSPGEGGLTKTHVGSSMVNSEGDSVIGFSMSIADDTLAEYINGFIVNDPPEKGMPLHWVRLEDLAEDDGWTAFFASTTVQTNELHQSDSNTVTIEKPGDKLVNSDESGASSPDQASPQILFDAATTKETRVRVSADKNSTLVTTIQKGTSVMILEMLTGADDRIWYRIQLQDGTVGYARSDFFKKN